MRSETEGPTAWWAQGLLFENCSCTVVCPGHVHFEQDCTYERCVGYWAMRFDAGDFAGVALGGLRAVVAYDSPQRMIEGGWNERIIIDETAAPEQREAVERILSGRAGGPWEVLARFVEKRLQTLYLPILIEDGETAKRVAIEGLLDSAIEAIRGRDRSERVRFENMFNQIHAPSQVIAKGDARYDDGAILVDNHGSHGLWSDFHWSVSGS